ncbi:MAG: dihydropteroate synthase [Burkholderiaceae bacterium]
MITCCRALAHARLLIEAGADILDLGAESSRPGAPAAVPADIQLAAPGAVAGCAWPVVRYRFRWFPPIRRS